ncbi:tRNA (uracil-5-)-methyltransferase homolog A-like [Macrosteles quadrilineatus]|uniref:tRNA (uracil-5-)-methyltransferase homolog A-like n=1 Tax=Macrosteles quadrilineatus TaxID=74068 RepID=UPI0023E180B9|nr:tRNA (uracil-5-)-methyltransferase homolog A-like [Macrosteles quadrilineatus]
MSELPSEEDEHISVSEPNTTKPSKVEPELLAKEEINELEVRGCIVETKELANKNADHAIDPSLDIKSENPANDPYAYLERNGFTSEIFKIEVRGLPKFYGIGELKKLINHKLKLGSNKIKTPKTGSQWLYICFRNEEDKEEALKVLNGFKWKNKTLSASAAKPAPDPLVKRRNEASNDGNNSGKRQKMDDSRPQLERLKDSTVPLWRLTPDEQAAKKTENVTKILRNMVYDIERQNHSLKPHFCAQREKNEGTPLMMNTIVRSPRLDGYRNKCEFTIGIDSETGLPTVGMRLGSYATGVVGVAPVQDLPHVSDRMKHAVKVFEEFVRSLSLPVFDPETYTGHWRQLTIRWATRTDQLMLVVGIHPQQMTNEEKESFKEGLKDFFTAGEGRALNVTSLYYQEITKRRSGEEEVLHLVSGEPQISEQLCGLCFSISPLSFFQVNTEAAELLYDAVGTLTQLTVETTLVDVCCGTGSIGLSLAKNCGQVLGLEINEKAVEDAQKNASENNITNCEFFCGPAEEILQSVLDRAKFPDVVAVVDPPRAGLRQNAVVMLRRISKIKRIAYIACDLKCAVKNIVDLARPASKTLAGAPFVPMAVTPVDLFPHTDHCEVIIYLERADT